jgi:hypothetical protein
MLGGVALHERLVGRSACSGAIHTIEPNAVFPS